MSMHSKNKTSTALFILLCMATMAYGAEKPNKKHYASLHVVVDEDNSPAASLQNSPKLDLNTRHAIDQPLPGRPGHTPKFSATMHSSPPASPSSNQALLVQTAASLNNSSRSHSLSEHSHESSPKESAIELSPAQPSPHYHRPECTRIDHGEDCNRNGCQMVCGCIGIVCLAAVLYGVYFGAIEKNH